MRLIEIMCLLLLAHWYDTFLNFTPESCVMKEILQPHHSFIRILAHRPFENILHCATFDLPSPLLRDFKRWVIWILGAGIRFHRYVPIPPTPMPGTRGKDRPGAVEMLTVPDHFSDLFVVPLHLLFLLDPRDPEVGPQDGTGRLIIDIAEVPHEQHARSQLPELRVR